MVSIGYKEPTFFTKFLKRLSLPPIPISLMATNGGDLSGGTVKYRECLRNYAARSMRYIYDGCGDFEPSGRPGTFAAVLCAVCGCHRNFHRREPQNSPLHHYRVTEVNIFHPHTTNVVPQSPPSPSSQPQSHNSKHATTINPLPVESLPTNPFNVNDIEGEMETKKRHRTKFTKEQKDGMRVFAERLGWRLPRRKEQEIRQFCDDMGITRKILKAWFCNNKRSFAPSSSTHQN